MRFALFYHSLISDWNHGNAHFLRGIATELLARGHELRIYEPRDGWSLTQLRQEHGARAVEEFHAEFPRLTSELYDERSLDVERALEDVDVCIVHEWNSPALVARVGAAAAASRVVALFHDTHHRAVTAPQELAGLDLRGYAGVLAFGEVLREIWLRQNWVDRAWTWHEAADTRLFKPLPDTPRVGDLIWIGNWGDGERAAELEEFLLAPVRELGLNARLHGVRYPPEALARFRGAGFDYQGWIPNYRVPQAFARFGCTVHVPRQAYARRLPGIPTIRVFEALACGIPLVSAPWEDSEGLFAPGEDFLVAADGAAMRERLRALREDTALAAELARRGRAVIEKRHSCAHRVDELLRIVAGLLPARRWEATGS
jgi:spore maturation protein CgeB